MLCLIQGSKRGFFKLLVLSSAQCKSCVVCCTKRFWACPFAGFWNIAPAKVRLSFQSFCQAVEALEARQKGFSLQSFTQAQRPCTSFNAVEGADLRQGSPRKSPVLSGFAGIGAESPPGRPQLSVMLSGYAGRVIQPARPKA